MICYSIGLTGKFILVFKLTIFDFEQSNGLLKITQNNFLVKDFVEVTTSRTS